MMGRLTLYPAIDILDGRAVRLRQGDYTQAQVYDADPVAAARRWQAAGAEWLHIVDLDGAREGAPAHLEIVAAIVAATGLPTQVGGGLRAEENVAAAFAAGAARVILGTTAAREPKTLARCLARWAKRIAVSVDMRAGQVAIAGWRETVAEDAQVFAKRMVEAGAQTLIVTSVERDGLLAGCDTQGLASLRAALPTTRLIAAGGLATLADVRELGRTGIDGAIVGRALYTGALDLRQALRTAEEAASG
jgi:phosphoribosylformimino-5-aminoimidazole carboxamide ribotide isomerase